jgi:hypothetical protein
VVFAESSILETRNLKSSELERTLWVRAELGDWQVAQRPFNRSPWYLIFAGRVPVNTEFHKIHVITAW